MCQAQWISKLWQRKDIYSKPADSSSRMSLHTAQSRTKTRKTYRPGRSRTRKPCPCPVWFTWGISKPGSWESEPTLLFVLVCRFLSSFTFISRPKMIFTTNSRFSRMPSIQLLGSLVFFLNNSVRICQTTQSNFTENATKNKLTFQKRH